jgi:hypothetical protein
LGRAGRSARVEQLAQPFKPLFSLEPFLSAFFACVARALAFCLSLAGLKDVKTSHPREMGEKT